MPLYSHAATPPPHLVNTHYYNAEYRIYVSGLLIGKVQLQLDLGDTNYRLSAHIAPAGFGHIASSAHVVATTIGRIEAHQLVPQRLDLSWIGDETVKSSFMTYKNGTPLEFVSGYQPDGDQKPAEPVVISQVGPGTRDPFAALLLPLGDAPLQNACNGDIRVFDGRRLSQLALSDGSIIAAAEHDYPARIAALACVVSLSPAGGYSKAALERSTEFPPLETHYGRIADSQFAAPLEMRGSSKYGALSIYAKRFFSRSEKQNPPFNIADFLADPDDDD